jgi:hypothetical protein
MTSRNFKWLSCSKIPLADVLFREHLDSRNAQDQGRLTFIAQLQRPLQKLQLPIYGSVGCVLFPPELVGLDVRRTQLRGSDSAEGRYQVFADTLLAHACASAFLQAVVVDQVLEQLAHGNPLGFQSGESPGNDLTLAAL